MIDLEKIYQTMEEEAREKERRGDLKGALKAYKSAAARCLGELKRSGGDVCAATPQIEELLSKAEAIAARLRKRKKEKKEKKETTTTTTTTTTAVTLTSSTIMTTTTRIINLAAVRMKTTPMASTSSSEAETFPPR